MNKEWFGNLISKGKLLKKDQLLIVVLSGVLLMIIAWPVNNNKNDASDKNNMTVDILSKSNELDEGNLQISKQDKNENSAEDTYISSMEDRLEKILSAMDNVGRAEVVITLKSSGEKIIEKDIPVSRSNTEEQDSQGGTRSVSNVDSGETTIYETDSGKSTPYVIKTISPQVEGVLVVCEGAGVGTVTKNITDAIEVLFGIEPHKIKVVKMKTG